MLELKSQTKGDIAGLTAVTLIIALLWLPARRLTVPDYALLAGWLVLLPASPFAWHSERWPQKPVECIALFFGSIAMGAMCLGADYLLSSGEGFPWVGSPFGSMLTLAICPGLSLIAAGGIARAYYLAKTD